MATLDVLRVALLMSTAPLCLQFPLLSSCIISVSLVARSVVLVILSAALPLQFASPSALLFQGLDQTLIAVFCIALYFISQPLICFSFLQGHIFHSDHAGLGWMFLPFHQVSVASDKSEPFCELFLFGMKFLSDFAVSHHLPFIHEVEHLKCFRLHCPLHIWALLSTWIMWICLHDRHSPGFSKLKFSGGLNLAIVFFLKILLRPCQIKLLASTAYWTPVSLLTNRAHTSPNLRTPWYFLFLLLAAPSVIGHRNILFQCNWYLNTPHTASKILLSAWFFFIFMCGDSYQ